MQCVPVECREASERGAVELERVNTCHCGVCVEPAGLCKAQPVAVHTTAMIEMSDVIGIL